MAKKVALFTDTASDILQFPELYEQLKPTVIYQYINIGSETFTDENLTLDQLLEKMEAATKKTWPKTSQPPVGDFVEIYEKLQKEGYTDIISVHVAGNLSGTINSARLAAEEVEGINVHIINSQMASLGIIPVLLYTHKLMEQGLEPAMIKEKSNAYAQEVELFAAVPTLENLYKGGRLKPVRFFLGSLLKFKPIIRMAEGELLSVDKTRNLDSTQEEAYKKAVAPYSPKDDFSLLISHAWDEGSALKFVQRFKEEYPGNKVYMGRVGPSMAVHLGPGGLVIMAFQI